MSCFEWLEEPQDSDSQRAGAGSGQPRVGEVKEEVLKASFTQSQVY